MWRAGATRALAAFLAHERPDVAAIDGIDAGDALAIATRCALQWAYGDGFATFWNARFVPLRVRDRGVWTWVDGKCDGEPAALVHARFAPDRERIRQVRALRTVLRSEPSRALLFASRLGGRTGFGDIGFSAQRAGDDCELAVRGLELDAVSVSREAFGTAARSRAIARA